jgi:hypothetical protein
MSEAPFLRSAGSSFADRYREKIDAALAEFSAEYRKKSERWCNVRPRIGSFVDAWREIRPDLARVTLRAEELEPLLKKSGLPCRPGETNPPTTAEEFRWAMAFSPFVRSRMNLSDMLFWMRREDLAVLP